MKKSLNLILVAGIIFLALSIIIKPRSGETTTPPPAGTTQKEASMPNPTQQYSHAEQVLEKNKEYAVTLKTSAGNIIIKLDTVHTPITANNFAFLTKAGYYNHTIFHRVIKGFMIQGGDPTGTGTGSPGYHFDDEYLQGEYRRGTVAMANSGPNTNGGQFFIMHHDYSLPNNYVIFGQVIQGMETVDKIANAEVQTNSSGEISSPVTPVTIESATIETL